MIFSGIAAAIGGVLSFIGGLGAIGTFALQMAAGIGVSYLAKALAGKKQESGQSGPSGVQGKLSSGGDVPRSFNVGDGATAGSLVYANTWGNDGQTPNAYFTQVIALSDLPVAGLNEIWVNGSNVTLGGVAHPDYGYPVSEYSKDGKDHLWIKFYDGTQSTADAFLTGRVSTTDRPYGVGRIGKGVAYVICTALVEDSLFTGFPSFLFGLSGIKLYDPSKDSSVGGEGDHRYSDPSTWGGDGDKLPAVQIYNLLRGLTYADQWFYGLQGLATARLPSANWIAQINKCRAEVDAGGGVTEPAYRSGGQIELSSQLGDTIESLLTSCHGKLSEVGGFYKVFLGEPDSPSFSFTDNDILSTEEQSFTPFFGLSDTVTGITAKYPEPEEAWALKPAPPIYRSDLDAQAGNRRLLTDVSLDFVPYSTQAQRLMKSALEAAQRARRHTLTLPPSFWFVEPGDVGEWSSARNGYDGKLFEVNGAVDKANLDVTLDLTEVDPADYDWDYDFDYQPSSSGSTAIERPEPQGIVDWYAEPAIIKDSNDINRRPAIRLSWDGSLPGIIGVQYEVRLKSDASHVTRGRTDQVVAGAILVTQSLLPNVHYQVRGQYIPSSPRDMLWSDWLAVTTPDVRFSVLDFDNSLSELVTGNFQSEAERIDKIVQLVSATVAQAFTKADADKRVVRSELYAQAGSLFASVEQVQQVVATNEEAFAAFQTTVNASLGEQSASITENATAVATINGKLVGQYTVTLDSSGYQSGFQFTNDGSFAPLTIRADVFQVAWPGMTGGGIVPVFQIANVNGVAKLSFRGDMYADGDITARSLNVATVDAITANLGTVETGEIRSPDDLFLIDATNKQIIISDNT